MGGRIDLMIEWGIQPIRSFLDVVPEHLDYLRSQTHDGDPIFLSNGKLSRHESLKSARQVSLIAVVERLNALVDEVVLMIANRISPESSLTREALSRSRHQLLKVIEDAYSIHASDLPGWSAVEVVREDANSLKHRGGVPLPEKGSLDTVFIPSRNLQLDVEVLRIILNDIERWLLSLWRVTEGPDTQRTV